MLNNPHLQHFYKLEDINLKMLYYNDLIQDIAMNIHVFKMTKLIKDMNFKTYIGFDNYIFGELIADFFKCNNTKYFVLNKYNYNIIEYVVNQEDLENVLKELKNYNK